MNRAWYAIHRWLSLAILAQFAVWLCSGLFFAAFPIAEVHGEHADTSTPLTTDDGAALVSPATALGIAVQLGFGSVEALDLRLSASRPVYVARGAHHTSLRLDARTGALLLVDQVEAETIARRDQRGEPAVLDAVLVTADPPIEYRDRPLPAWRVSLADGAGTAVWVDAHSGEVTARRNDRWRQYDFLWSLHIMDYRGREEFHHPLLIAAALLGLLTVVSGTTLWVLRLARWARRRRSRRPSLPTVS
jgi:uncharacterized iron-regulated membrane protein